VTTFEEFLRRVAGLKTPLQVLKMPDIPRKGWLLEHFKRYPNDKLRLLELLDSLPFAFQAKAQYGMGKQFTDEVSRLRREGFSDKRIAARLGVTAMTVHRHRRKASIE
jgi:hypothetical protein